MDFLLELLHIAIKIFVTVVTTAIADDFVAKFRFKCKKNHSLRRPKCKSGSGSKKYFR
jgi:hypothetical protein